VVHDRRSERKVMLEFGSITDARRAVTF